MKDLIGYMKGVNKILSIGDVGVNTYGSKYILVDFAKNGKPIIEFQDEWKYRAEIYPTNFKEGNAWNPYQINCYGKGYLGEGPYMASENGRDIPPYSAWRNVLKRCYHEPYMSKHQSYIGCEVDPVWYNYQNFAKWWEENYYVIDDERMQFDKDVLVRGNRLYSPDRCCIIPQSINILYQNIRRGSNPAVGVHMRGKKFIAMYCTQKLGTFETLDEAIGAHYRAKKEVIVNLAEHYKGRMPDKIYKAMLEY